MTRVPFLMWRMVLSRPYMCAAHALAFALNNIAPLAPGLVVSAIFDSLANPSVSGSGVFALIALLVGVAAGRAGILMAGGLTDSPRAFSMYILVCRNLLGGILRRPGATAVQVSPGEAVTLFRDDAGEVEDVLSNIPDLAGAAVSLALAVIILFRVDARLTGLVFLPLCAVVAVAQVAGEFIENRRRASRAATERSTGALGEVLGAVQSVQIAGAEEAATEHLGRLNEVRRKAALRDKALGLLMEALQTGTVSIGGGIIMLLAARSIGSGSLSIGGFSLFVSYLVVVGEHSVYLGGWGARLRQLRVAFDRMAEVLGGAPTEDLVVHRPLYFAAKSMPVTDELESESAARHEVASGGYEPLETLSVRGLSAIYPGTGKGIRDVDLDLRAGTLTAVTGEVGSGKTTLLRAVLGLMPAEGEVLWNGREVCDPSSFMTPPRCAYVPQVPALFSGTIRDNILLGSSDVGNDVAEAASLAVLEEDLEGMPDGLDTGVGVKGFKLSGGQVQRVAAARALIRRPSLLVLDDLSSALDVGTEQALWDRLLERDSSGGLSATYLVASTRPSVLQRADRILVMKDGRIVDQGR